MRQMAQTDEFANILSRVLYKLIYFSDDVFDSEFLLNGYLQGLEWANYAIMRLRGLDHLLPPIDSISTNQELRYPMIVKDVISQRIPSIDDIRSELYDIIPNPREIKPYLQIFKQKMNGLGIPTVDGINDNELISFSDVMYGDNIYTRSINAACREGKLSKEDAEYMSLSISTLFAHSYWLRVNVRGIVADFEQMAGMQTTLRSDSGSLPDKLNNDKAKAYFDKAVKFGFISSDYTRWLGTREQLAYFADAISFHLDWRRDKYKTIETHFSVKNLAQDRKKSSDSGRTKDMAMLNAIFE